MTEWTIVCRLSLGVAVLACVTLANTGYLSFYGATRSDVLNNLACEDPAVNAARMLLALTMVFTYPMEQFVARHSLHAVAFRGAGPITSRRHYGLTLLLWGSSLVVGLVVKDLGVVLELTGAFSASMLGYILPAVVHFRLNPFGREWGAALAVWARSWRGEADSEDGDAGSPPSLGERWRRSYAAAGRVVPPTCLLIFGLLAMVLGTTSAVLGALEVNAGAAEGSCVTEDELANGTAMAAGAAGRALLRMLP